MVIYTPFALIRAQGRCEPKWAHCPLYGRGKSPSRLLRSADGGAVAAVAGHGRSAAAVRPGATKRGAAEPGGRNEAAPVASPSRQRIGEGDGGVSHVASRGAAPRVLLRSAPTLPHCQPPPPL